MASIEHFRSVVETLVSNFQSDKIYCLSKGYLEAQARTDFITPFFEALGWDVSNKAGLLHGAREVIVEKGESDTNGRPDYSYRVGGQVKFFVEAKAPSERHNITKHILQAKTYVWNTREVLFVVLTDFAEFRFYDASIQPDSQRPDAPKIAASLKRTNFVTLLIGGGHAAVKSIYSHGDWIRSSNALMRTSTEKSSNRET